MQSQLVFPLTAARVSSLSPADLFALNEANPAVRDGDCVVYVPAADVAADQFCVARVDGVVGVHRGAPTQGEIVGRVTAWCRPH